MSAQAEEVVASAKSLADMAIQLDELVARFKLATDSDSSAAFAQAGNGRPRVVAVGGADAIGRAAKAA